MGDKVRIAISAKTMEGLAAIDPEVKIDVVEIEPTPQQIAHGVIQDFSGSVIIEIPTPDTFPSWQFNGAFSRFDAGSALCFSQEGTPILPMFFNVRDCQTAGHLCSRH